MIYLRHKPGDFAWYDSGDKEKNYICVCEFRNLLLHRLAHKITLPESLPVFPSGASGFLPGVCVFL